MEAPVFEFTLQDTVASAGADVLLKTIIAGTPCPDGNISYFTLEITKPKRIFKKTSWVECLSILSLSKLPGQKTT